MQPPPSIVRLKACLFNGPSSAAPSTRKRNRTEEVVAYEHCKSASASASASAFAASASASAPTQAIGREMYTPSMIYPTPNAVTALSLPFLPTSADELTSFASVFDMDDVALPVYGVVPPSEFQYYTPRRQNRKYNSFWLLLQAYSSGN